MALKTQMLVDLNYDIILVVYTKLLRLNDYEHLRTLFKILLKYFIT